MKKLQELTTRIARKHPQSEEYTFRLSVYFDYDKDNFHIQLPVDSTNHEVGALLMAMGKKIMEVR